MDSKEIIKKLNEEAAKYNYEFIENDSSAYDDADSEIVLRLQGYKPDYDLRADFGNQYPHDIFDIVEKICIELFGKPDKPKYTEKKFFWGVNSESWNLEDKIITNHIYGHPRNGFFETYLYIE